MDIAADPQLLYQYQQSFLAYRNTSVLNYPAHVHIETFAKCNGSCGFCPYTSLSRKGARMDDNLIEKIIADLCDIPHVHPLQISPFKVNEPFLDHRLFDILDSIHQRLPNASITLTTNASPLTAEKLKRLNQFTRIGYLWVSLNDHRQIEYTQTMGLDYHRTLDRLNLLHDYKISGTFKPRVVLSRVSDGSPVDVAFVTWVRANYPAFEVSLFPRGEWIGQIKSRQSAGRPVKTPDIACMRWFELSITATGTVAHCCMDGHAEYPIGDVRTQHLLDIYNSRAYRRLRAGLTTRLHASPCSGCQFR